MRDVVLYGYLGRKYGKKHRLEVSSVAESIRAFNANYKDFLKDIKERSFKVLVGSNQLTEEELKLNFTKGSIHIVPVPEGAKSKWVGIIAGAALIASAFITGGTSIAAWGLLSKSMALMGAGLILSGVSSMLAPVDTNVTSPERPEARPSFIYNGPINTMEQGGSVPIVYGRMIVGSKIVASEMIIEDLI